MRKYITHNSTIKDWWEQLTCSAVPGRCVSVGRIVQDYVWYFVWIMIFTKPWSKLFDRCQTNGKTIKNVMTYIDICIKCDNVSSWNSYLSGYQKDRISSTCCYVLSSSSLTILRQTKT